MGLAAGCFTLFVWQSVEVCCFAPFALCHGNEMELWARGYFELTMHQFVLSFEALHALIC